MEETGAVTLILRCLRMHRFRQTGFRPLHSLVIGLLWDVLLISPLQLASGNVTFTASGFRDIATMAVSASLSCRRKHPDMR